jgi:hypothetical protein
VFSALRRYWGKLIVRMLEFDRLSRLFCHESLFVISTDNVADMRSGSDTGNT